MLREQKLKTDKTKNETKIPKDIVKDTIHSCEE